jgi:hypothetical protein
MEREKCIREIVAACRAMDSRALLTQLRIAKRAAVDWPEEQDCADERSVAEASAGRRAARPLGS